MPLTTTQLKIERDREREMKKKKNTDDAAKFVDSLLRAPKTEREKNDKIAFFLAKFAHGGGGGGRLHTN